jgi:phage RecT family recombinase
MPPTDPRAQFGALVQRQSERLLGELLGTDEAKQIAARLAITLRQIAASAPAIYDCEPASVAECVALSALSGLNPGGPLPHVYVVPRRIKGVQRLQWMISWRGLAELARRSGYAVRAVPVHREDSFTLTLGLSPDIQHAPSDAWPPTVHEDLRGVYVVATEIETGRLVGFEWVSASVIEARRAKSDSWKSGYGPWKEWPVEMALKTAIRYAIQRGLVSISDLGAIAYQRDGEQDAAERIDVTPEAPAAKPRPQLAEFLPPEEIAPEPEPEPVMVPVRAREELLAIAGDLGAGKVGPEARKALGLPLSAPLASLSDEDLGRLVDHLESVAGGGE